MVGGARLCGVLAAPGGAGSPGAGEATDVVMVTRGGIVKRLAGDELAAGGPRMSPAKVVFPVPDGDEVVAAFACPPGADVMMISSDGALLRTSLENLVRRRSGAAGTAGMKLRPGAGVIGAGRCSATPTWWWQPLRGRPRPRLAEDFSPSGRGGMGGAGVQPARR